jgi:hypothetical protein
MHKITNRMSQLLRKCDVSQQRYRAGTFVAAVIVICSVQVTSQGYLGRSHQTTIELVRTSDRVMSHLDGLELRLRTRIVGGWSQGGSGHRRQTTTERIVYDTRGGGRFEDLENCRSGCPKLGLQYESIEVRGWVATRYGRTTRWTCGRASHVPSPAATPSDFLRGWPPGQPRVSSVQFLGRPAWRISWSRRQFWWIRVWIERRDDRLLFAQRMQVVAFIRTAKGPTHLERLFASERVTRFGPPARIVQLPAQCAKLAS